MSTPMNGFAVSFVTTVVTIVISFFVALIVKLMTVLLDKFAAPPQKSASSADLLVFSDESDIAAVIAIAQSMK